MKPLSANAKAVMAMLERAVEAGYPCPSNYEIAAALGAGSISIGPAVLDQLARAGLISIERGQRTRVVTVIANGKRTAGVIGLKHWRDRPENSHRRRIGYGVRPAKPEAPVELPVRVYRDPCQRCGTRGDIGCRHGRSGSLVSA